MTADAPGPQAYTRHLLQLFAGGDHERFLAAGGRPLRPRVARALALADLRPGIAVVDVGCGRGEALLHVQRRGCSALGIDSSLGALSLARETMALVEPGAQGRAAWLVAAAEAGRLPVRARSVDRVLVLDVVEHLTPAAWAACLSEIRRILAPGGRVVVHTLPNVWALRVAYPFLRALLRDLPVRPRSAYEQLVHVNEQSPAALRRALEGADLECRVWVEEWTTRYAARALSGPAASTPGDRAARSLAGAAPFQQYPDAPRRRGYPQLARPVLRRAARLIMRTPAGVLAGNDIYAIAWPAGEPPPPIEGRLRPVR